MPVPKWNETKKFKALKDKWYKKLERTGFVDAEQDETYLHQYSGKVSATDTLSDSEDLPDKSVSWDHILGNQPKSDAKFEYYRWCRMMLNDFEFKTVRARRVFEMHSEGIGERDIAKQMKLTRSRINTIIKELVKSMRSK